MVYRKFQWREGSTLMIDAQTAGERLEAIENKHGTITPELVLQDARSARSPLHDAFEWDNASAAEKYRQEQAKYLLRSIVVTVEESGKEFVDVRAFVSVKDDAGDRSYVSLGKAMSDEDLRKQVIDRALDELDQWRRRYEQYKELASVVKSISKFQKLKTA